MESLLLEWFIRGTFLLGLGCLGAAAVRQGPAARRAQVWRLAVLGTLALPALALAGIRMHVPLPMPASWAVTKWTGTASSTAEAEGAGVDHGLTPRWVLGGLGESSSNVGEVGGGSDRSLEVSNGVPAVMGEPPLRSMSGGDRGRTRSLGSIWIWVWIAGAGLWLSRLLVQVRRAARVVRTASPLPFKVGAASAVGSPDCGSPFVFDPRPVGPVTVVLPLDFHDQSEATRAAVLRHEEAHVERWDGGYFLVAAALRCLLWFHPLAWLAERRLRAESERACDDAALQSGMKRADFAELLLKAATPGQCAPVPTMGWVGCLEERVVALLDAGQTRGSDSRPRSWSLGLGGGVLVLAAAILTPALKAQVPAGSSSQAGSSPSEATPSSAHAPGRDTALERSLTVLLALRDESIGAWRADAGYKLNERWRVTSPNEPHVGVTALALEALVAGGQCEEETVSCSRTAITEATEFILDHQTPRGYFRSSGTRLRSHAYALAALSRLALTEPSPRLIEALQRGLRFSLEARGPGADGWYFEPLSKRADLVETGFQMQAIEAAVRVLEPRGDAESLKLVVKALKAREVTARFARSAFSEDASRDAGYTRQVLGSDEAFRRTDYRATAAGLWLERAWLVENQPKLFRLEDGLATFRSARSPKAEGLHFATLDAEMIFARLENSVSSEGALGELVTRLTRDSVSVLTSKRSIDGQFHVGVGAGPSFTQAAGCLVLAQVNATGRFYGPMTLVNAEGVEKVIDVDGSRNVLEMIPWEDLDEPFSGDAIRALLIRSVGPSETLELPVELQAIVQGDTRTNYSVQPGDILRIFRN